LPADYLFIVRHGETEANAEGIEAGPLDYPLTKKGVKGASFISKSLAKVDFTAVYSSPIFRAQETAKILARPHGLKVKTMEDLTETKIKPEFVGKKGRHHILTDPDAYAETVEELRIRVGRAIQKIKVQADGNVIVVSHGDVITAFIDIVVERKLVSENHYVLHPEPAALSIVQIKDRPFLVLYNYHRKLFGDY
jgi:broad specificity phosphatase PhoE